MEKNCICLYLFFSRLNKTNNVFLNFCPAESQSPRSWTSRRSRINSSLCWPWPMLSLSWDSTLGKPTSASLEISAWETSVKCLRWWPHKSSLWLKTWVKGLCYEESQGIRLIYRVNRANYVFSFLFPTRSCAINKPRQSDFDKCKICSLIHSCSVCTTWLFVFWEKQFVR